MSTQPRPVPDASQYTSKDLVLSGWAKIGAVVNYLRVWKAISHFSSHTNFTPFFNSSVIGLAILEKSWHAVSTFQTWSAGPTMVRSSIDSDGAKTPRNPVLLPYLYIIIIPRPVSYFHVNFNNSGTVYKYITYISRVTGNYSTSKYPISRECKKSLDFYREVLSIAFLSSYTC